MTPQSNVYDLKVGQPVALCKGTPAQLCHKIQQLHSYLINLKATCGSYMGMLAVRLAGDRPVSKEQLRTLHQLLSRREASDAVMGSPYFLLHI